MDKIIRFCLRFLFRLAKVHSVWLKKPSKYPRVVLYLANHVSALDVFFLYAFLPSGVCFALDETTYKRRSTRILMHFANKVIFNPILPNDIKEIVKHLQDGISCAIFAEGKETETGNLMKIYEAPGVIADRANVPFVPIWIDGAQYGYYSHLKDKKCCRPFPRTIITIHEAVPFSISALGSKSRDYISNEIYKIMQEVSFRASFNPSASVFAEFIKTAKSHAHIGLFSRPLVAEDITHKKYSYKDLAIRAYLYGEALQPIIGWQENFGVLLGNSIETFCILLGAMAYERTPAMLNYTAGVASVLSGIRTSGIKIVLTEEKFIIDHHLEQLIENIKLFGILVIYIEELKKKFNLIVRLNAWYNYKIKYVPFPKSAHKKALILFTSGSEGFPKAVVLSHQNLVANIRQFSTAVDINRTDIVFNCLPLFHSFGLVIGTFYPLLAGGKVFIYPSPLHYRAIPEMIYNVEATILFGTDSFLHSYAKVAHPFDFHTLRFVLGAAEPVRAETRALWIEKFGIRIFEGYGSTECSPFLTVNNRIFCSFQSVGKFLPAISYKLKSIDGIENAGDLCVKGPNIMLGYMTSEKPGEIISPQAGWFETGDVVSIDDMGYLYIKGRLRRFAKIAGEMVSLSMIEKLIMQAYSHVDFEVAVVAIPHSTRGEQIIAVSTSRKIDLKKVAPFIQQQGFSELYIPREIIYRKQIPMLGSGKRDYLTLKEILIKRETEKSKAFDEKT